MVHAFTSGVRHAEALLQEARKQRSDNVAQLGSCAVKVERLQTPVAHRLSAAVRRCRGARLQAAPVGPAVHVDKTCKTCATVTAVTQSVHHVPCLHCKRLQPAGDQVQQWRQAAQCAGGLSHSAPIGACTPAAGIGKVATQHSLLIGLQLRLSS